MINSSATLGAACSGLTRVGVVSRCLATLAVLALDTGDICSATLWAQATSRGTIYRHRGVDPVAKPLPLPAPSATADTYSLKLTTVRAIDGSNSAGTPGQGAAHVPLLRKAGAEYPGDGSGTQIIGPSTRANPRTISNRIVSQGAVVMPNSRNLTNYVWAWGQFIDHDLDLTSSSAANGNADIPILDANDPLAPNPIPFDRSNFQPGTGTAGQPRQQINEITAFMDASNVYGSSDGRAQALRTFQGGKLKTSAGDLLPFNVDGIDNAGGPSPALFLAGDVRANENVMLLAMHTLFVREHNRLTTLLTLLDPDASDETIYQLARKIVAAELQIITYKEWLPALLGRNFPKPEQLAFSAQINPGIATEFSTALFRVGHTLLSANLPLAENGVITGGISLQTAFFNPAFLASDPANVDRLLEGFAREPSQEIDNKIVDDVRNFLFGPPGAGGMDLASLNIQRGRDHGLPDYNTVRAAYGLRRVSRFDQISSSSDVQNALEELYGSVNNIDVWIGALAEDHLPGSSVGPLIDAALREQFRRIAMGDKFFYHRDPDLKQPAVTAIVNLEALTFADIVRVNSTVSDMTADAFLMGTPVKTDVIASYNPTTNRLHVTGNRRANSVAITATPLGILVTGHSGTLINGRSAILVTTKARPKLTVDLNDGDDTLTVMLGQFGDGLIVLGEGTNRCQFIFASFANLVTDIP